MKISNTKDGIMEEQKNKKDIRYIENKQQDGKHKP